MHNVNVEALEQSATTARKDPQAMRQHVELGGDWDTTEGRAQFRATIPFPQGQVEFTCDFPPPLGGSGAAPNPLAYCFWGGLACYAMTFATEAARENVELRALRGRVETDVDLSRALGVSERPPVEQIRWSLEIDTDAPAELVERLKQRADERCPGVYCIRNPIELVTAVSTRSEPA